MFVLDGGLGQKGLPAPQGMPVAYALGTKAGTRRATGGKVVVHAGPSGERWRACVVETSPRRQDAGAGHAVGRQKRRWPTAQRQGLEPQG